MASLGAPPPIRRLTDAAIDQVSQLPINYDPVRQANLPQTLEEWWTHELPLHLETEAYAERLARKKRLRGTSSAVRSASSKLSSLNPDDLEFLTVHVARKRRKRGMEFSARVDAFKLETKRAASLLNRIAAAAGKAEFKRSRETVWPLLIMRDHAALFRYFTRREPVRNVGGHDAGDFAEFSEQIWNATLGEETGWFAAMKKWDKSDAAERESSAFMANLFLRHPEWRVLRR